MAQKKKIVSSKKNDTKVAGIILGLSVVGIILFVLFSKGKEQVAPKSSLSIRHVEHLKPVEHLRLAEPRHIEAEEVPVEAKPAETTPQPFENVAGSGGKIAFIIDDWGQTTGNCKYLREIPDPMAVSILPGLRRTKDVASCAKLYHKLVMLHLPLEALHNFDFYPPNYIIKTSMSPDLASKIVDEDLAQIPSIEGVNNHMGSKATENKSLMRLIFKKIKKKRLFFVDSMTAHSSVCSALADEMGLTFGKRDVFLDNVNTRDAITRQMIELAQKARHKGYAVAIGHDRKLTMQVLKEEIPWLKKQGFQIVSIKELLTNR